MIQARRGILAFMGAGAASASVKAKQLPVQGGVVSARNGRSTYEAPSERGICAPSHSVDWDGFYKTLKPHDRRREYQSRVAALLGDMPPHLASMHSNAPWFRAQAAARWTMRQEEEYQTIREKLQSRFTQAISSMLGGSSRP